ncbi:hypothetical protein LLE87_31030, partial [Paenibacillus polymyxa]|nr:hypothetical protein [Paenibacillus polymyxa]
DEIGMPLPDPLPRATKNPPKSEVQVSPSLSLTARPGDGGVATRKVASLAAEGVDGKALSAVADALMQAGAVVRLVGQRIGPMQTGEGVAFDADASL